VSKRLLLIQPIPRDTRLVTKSTRRLYPLGILVLDALTPKDDWDVRIVDEGRERFDVDAVGTDTLTLAGINSWTSQATRAYEIAQTLRARGVPVIMGGPHPSVLPGEALQFSDSVCVGEAESVWPLVLQDIVNGGLKPVYHGGTPALSLVPVLRNPLRDEYSYGSIQTSRGCPYDCHFCSVSAINGATIRYRPIADVLEEFRSIRQKIVFVVDDNFIGSGRSGRERAIELCQGLAGLRKEGVRKYWGTQATQNLGRDSELLKWMYRAGCRLVLFGLESLNENVIKEMNKGINGSADYAANIRNTQRHGIGVIGSFMFGNDSDPPSALEDTVRFIKRTRLATQNLNFSSPLPGTRFFEEMASTGRLRYTSFPEDWEKYNLNQLVVEPKGLSSVELYKKRIWAEAQLNGRINLLRSTMRTLLETRSPSTAAIALAWNLQSGSREEDYRQEIELLRHETKAHPVAGGWRCTVPKWRASGKSRPGNKIR